MHTVTERKKDNGRNENPALLSQIATLSQLLHEVGVNGASPPHTHTHTVALRQHIYSSSQFMN